MEALELLMKREDLNHPFTSGNKWWKLKYNLEQVAKTTHKTVLTFGGAYSNHLYATAAAAHELGMKSIGLVRGEEALPLNKTLSFSKSCGMELHYLNRETYRQKNDKEVIASLRKRFGDFYLIPEGGTNELAIKGCEEWARHLENEIDFDYLCLPVGTGGTVAGLINGMPRKNIIGFSVLKGGDFLNEEVKKWVHHGECNWRIETAYHFGGYAKTNTVLSDFIAEFENSYGIPLDPVYTGKMMYGVFDLIKQKAFKPGSRILVLHTGGLQGRAI